MNKSEKIKQQGYDLVTESEYVTSPTRAKSILHEIRGFIISHFGMVDSILMDKLNSASKRCIKVSNKKSTKDE